MLLSPSPSNIFKKFSPNEREKEIFCNELLLGTFQLVDPNNGINGYELEKFRNYIRLINDYLCTLNDDTYSIENLLKTLIDKQFIYRIDFEMINDIETLNIVHNDQEFPISCIQLREIWLKND